MIKTFLSNCGLEQVQIVISASELELAFRNVLSDLLAKKQEADADEKVSRTMACKRLRKTPMTLTRWEQAGKIHPIRVGRSIFYSEKEIKAIEEGRK